MLSVLLSLGLTSATLSFVLAKWALGKAVNGWWWGKCHWELKLTANITLELVLGSLQSGQYWKTIYNQQYLVLLSSLLLTDNFYNRKHISSARVASHQSPVGGMIFSGRRRRLSWTKTPRVCSEIVPLWRQPSKARQCLVFARTRKTNSPGFCRCLSNMTAECPEQRTSVLLAGCSSR